MNETLQYIGGWEYCTHCGTFRPERQLDADGRCVDSKWCGVQARRRRKERNR